jgi:hypothetical protein
MKNEGRKLWLVGDATRREGTNKNPACREVFGRADVDTEPSDPRSLENSANEVMRIFQGGDLGRKKTS